MGFFGRLFGGKDKFRPIEISKIEVESSTEEKTIEGYPYDHKVSTTIMDELVELYAETYVVSSPGYRYWVSIVHNGKRYGFSPEINTWSHRATGVPPNSDEIATWIKAEIKKFQPAHLPEGSIKTVYSNMGKTKYSLKGEVTVCTKGKEYEHTIWAYLKPNTRCFDLVLNDWKWGYKLDDGEYMSFPSSAIYLEKAISFWLQEEYRKLKEL